MLGLTTPTWYAHGTAFTRKVCPAQHMLTVQATLLNEFLQMRDRKMPLHLNQWAKHVNREFIKAEK